MARLLWVICTIAKPSMALSPSGLLLKLLRISSAVDVPSGDASPTSTNLLKDVYTVGTLIVLRPMDTDTNTSRAIINVEGRFTLLL